MSGPSLSRRLFLGTAALGTAAVGAGVAGAALDRPGTSTVDGAAAAGRVLAAPGRPAAVTGLVRGPHQPGILMQPAAHGLLAAFTCIDPDRRTLAGTLRTLSGEIDALMAGEVERPTSLGLPPPDNGVLDGYDDTWVSATLSVGASLFDRRYGLGRRKPRELTTMPFFPNDRLDPARSHGDLFLLLQADQPDTCLHAVRRLMRVSRGSLVLHWMLPGFSRPDAQPKPGRTDTRNLLGFKDGTANPDAGDSALMDQLVWTGAGQGEPEWTAGGSYQVVRAIRMFVEQWDRASLGEQESIIGRHKRSGAAIGRAHEIDAPDYAADPGGREVPIDAHIRLANPRTPAAMGARILRRGLSYSRGFDGAGLLDQGLAFVSYQRRLSQFVAIQRRLGGERLEEYIMTEGGGYFFALPGVARDGDWLGQSLLES
jgi:deferrochelatase/peroxidase EfeB